MAATDFALFRGRLFGVLLLVVGSAPVLRVAFYYLAPQLRGQILMMFHTGFDSIAAGVLLGGLLRRPSSGRWLERTVGNHAVIGGLVAFLIFFSPLLRERFKGLYDLPIGRTLDLAAICAIITAGVSFPGTLLFKVLNWRPLMYLGVLSYSLYVWNNLFLLTDGFWFNIFPLNLVCVRLAALFSHYLVENPFLDLKARFTGASTV